MLPLFSRLIICQFNLLIWLSYELSLLISCAISVVANNPQGENAFFPDVQYECAGHGADSPIIGMMHLTDVIEK